MHTLPVPHTRVAQFVNTPTTAVEKQAAAAVEDPAAAASLQ